MTQEIPEHMKMLLLLSSLAVHDCAYLHLPSGLVQYWDLLDSSRLLLPVVPLGWLWLRPALNGQTGLPLFRACPRDSGPYVDVTGGRPFPSSCERHLEALELRCPAQLAFKSGRPSAATVFLGGGLLSSSA